MKTRESGMPEERLWDSFFNPELVLERLGLNQIAGDVAELGCGYGTFTLPAARRTTGTLHAFDIDKTMVARTLQKAAAEGAGNVRGVVRDFVEHGTGLPAGSVSCVMLFNLLHAECPEALLAEAWRVMAPGGILAVMHWNYDPSTPRGPSMSIRPRPEQCRDWAVAVGFQMLPAGIVDLPPYHYGMALHKPT